MSKNRSPAHGSGRASRPRFGTNAPSSSRSGSSSWYCDVALRPRLPPAVAPGAEHARANPVAAVELGKLVERREAPAGRDADRLEREPLVGRHPRDQRQVIVLRAGVLAVRAPATDRAMLDRLRIGRSRRNVAGVLGDERLRGAAYAPLIGGEVSDPERRDLAVSEREVHPSGLCILELREQAAVEGGLENGARLGGPCQLRVDHLMTAERLSRLAASRLRQDVGTNQEVRASQQRRPAILGVGLQAHPDR